MTAIVEEMKHNQNFIHKIASSKLFWVIAIFTFFTYPIYRSLNRTLPPPLPVYATVPEFSFTNEFGKPFGSKELKGKFYVANFFFTSCPSTCPRLMEKMDVIQKRIKGVGSKMAIVSFTVNPETDTVDEMYKYARKRHANPHIWSFLTGDKAQLQKTVVEGFKVPMGDGKVPMDGVVDGKTVTMMDIVHSEKVVLVDDQGRIRGYYSVDKENMDKMMIDIGLLINNAFTIPSKNEGV